MHCDAVMRRMLVVTALVTGLAVSQSAGAQVYKSTGDEGETVYSDQKPASGQVERVELSPSPSPADVEQGQAEVDAVNSALDEIAEQRRQEKADKLAEQQAKEQQQAACEKSKHRLNQLELYPPNRRLVVYPDGTSKRVSHEEMQSLIESARTDVRSNCESE